MRRKRTNFFFISFLICAGKKKIVLMYVIEETTFYTSWLVKKTRKCNSKRRGGSDVSRFGILCFLPFLGLISGKSYSAKMSYVINVVVLLSSCYSSRVCPCPGKYTFFSLKYKCTCEIFHT